MFFDQIKKLCKVKGISPTDFVENELHMSRSNVTKWKIGKVPKSSTVQKIAAYFGVSTDYLLGNKEKPSAEAEGLSSEAIELSKRIDLLSPANRAKLSELVDLYLSAQDKKK